MLGVGVFIALATSAVIATKTTVGRVDIVNAGALNLDGTHTDVSIIADTAAIVDQKSGPTPKAPPNLPPADTTVTALDGQLVNMTVPSSPLRRSHARRIQPKRGVQDDYEVVFTGASPSFNAPDGFIKGTAFITFTTVDNSTYNIDACLDFCSSTQGCVFANLFYELNNPSLDSSSNLKCSLFGDVHTAAEKIVPEGPIVVENSSGFAAKNIEDPETPEGYKLVGLFPGANNAPGYMGFVFLSSYDVQACSQVCNARNADASGGGCQYFNIWRAVIKGAPTTYTCSLYFVPSNASTAVNTGQGDLKVTFSRGFRRISVLPDGGFEQTPCDSDFCFLETTPTWIGSSPPGGFEDTLIFFFKPYAHSGNAVVSLGAGTGLDSFPGTISPRNSLRTIPGRKYSIQFFHMSAFNEGFDEEFAFVDIFWNNRIVSVIHPGREDWTFYQFEVVAQGNDTISFIGGSFPSYDFLDDINVFLA